MARGGQPQNSNARKHEVRAVDQISRHVRFTPGENTKLKRYFDKPQTNWQQWAHDTLLAAALDEGIIEISMVETPMEALI